MPADVVPISDKLRESRESLLRRLLDAHTRGDADGVVDCFRHPRIEMIPSGRVLDGPEAVRSYLLEQRRTFPDQAFEAIRLHHSDQVVVAENWMTGTHAGEMHGVEPSGKRFRARVASIFEFDGEDLLNQRIYYDAGTIARQLA